MLDPNSYEIIRSIVVAGSVAMAARLLAIGGAHMWIVIDRLP